MMAVAVGRAHHRRPLLGRAIVIVNGDLNFVFRSCCGGGLWHEFGPSTVFRPGDSSFVLTVVAQCALYSEWP